MDSGNDGKSPLTLFDTKRKYQFKDITFNVNHEYSGKKNIKEIITDLILISETKKYYKWGIRFLCIALKGV